MFDGKLLMCFRLIVIELIKIFVYVYESRNNFKANMTTILILAR
jgi:hypothetical protein